MKISCNREQFSTLFSLAAAVVSIKDIKAVLQNVKMTAKDGNVVLCATDMDTAIRLVMEKSDVLEEGEVILPTKTFRKILQESNDDTISLELNGSHIVFRGDRSFYQIAIQAVEDFPEIPPFTSDSYHEIAGSALQEHIRRTVFAIDPESTKFALSGVLFEMTEGRLGTVATDGRRLANQEGTAVVHGGHNSEGNTIVPLKVLGLIEKAIGMTSEPIKISVSDGKITFATSKLMISSRLLEGRFPKWQNIIPNKSDRVKIDLMDASFLQCVRQADVVTTDTQPGIILHFTDGKLEISASGVEVGNSKIELPIAYNGEAIDVKLDPRYLIDFLRGLPNEAIVSVYLKEKQSVFFETNDGYSYILMPLS